ncbi:DUF2919 family protein [Candidatus Parabeggiatoa sp. HSG14]|uniref:DUF2919 family protein n=1 Tax=Candidatus Parabeggiatoa sp. HSG14 TaxID=3055593 RepID=UPI0025A83E29|nr:DUF2919 family protein [Thiotrichales bacterium HSG14]
MTKYRFEDYNEYNVLKVPLLLVLASIYLLKHFLIFALPMISTIPFLVRFAHLQFSVPLVLSGIPAILVIVAMLRRIPKTRSPILRGIWQWGKALLLSSLLLEVGFTILYIVLELKKFNEVSLVFLYLDIVLIIYLIKSQRVREVFAEFPDKDWSEDNR